ncbi:MAG: two-component system response regulator [Thermoguttaceae bacterium]
MTDARKSRILIADDEPFNRELLEAFLSEGNYELEYAADGQETLDKTASFNPDLILLDVMMPKLSGFEVCEKLKKDPQTSSVMILMVTALSDLGDVERAVAVGCDDFLCKPINQLELLIRVENLLKLRSVTSELERLRQYVDSMEDAFAPKKKA